MAVLKYKNASGEFVALTNYTVQPIKPVQTTGASTTEIMSQNAVTSALSTKANSADVYTKTESNTTFLSKNEASSTYLTQSSAQTTYATQSSVNSISNSITNINNSIDAINQEIGLGNTGDTSSSNPIIRQDDLTDYATKTYVGDEISALVNGAPETLDTLKELADALGNNENSVTTITTELGKKANSTDVYTKTETDNLLSGKAASSHNHAITDITNLSSTLDTKAEKEHTHSYAGSSSVGGAATSANKVNSTLTWSKGDTNGSFNGSANASFTIPTKTSELTNDSNFITTASTVNIANKVSHTISISGNGASMGSFDGSSDTDINITPSSIGAAAASHTHTIANITDLETTLNSKSDTSHTHNFSEIKDKPTTINGYSISDAKIENGVITLGTNTITPLTSHQTIYSLSIKNSEGTEQTNYTPNNSASSLTLTKAMVGLGNVENTKLSTWNGSENITTLGTITSGTWNGSKIANDYLVNNKITINGVNTTLGSSFNTASITSGNAGTSSATNGYTLSVPYVTLNQYGIATAYGTHTHTVNNIPNSSLSYSSINIAGTSVSLGGSLSAETLKTNLSLGSLAYKNSIAFSELTSKPTTISGYGITDANGANIKLSSSYVAVSDMPTVGSGNTLTASSTGNTLDSVVNRIETNIKLIANEVNENEEVAAYALTDLNNRLGEHVENVDVHIASEERNRWDNIYNFYEGVNTATSIASVPTSKRLCIVTISAGGSFTLANIPSAGREIHIIVNNTASTDIEITMPTDSGYVKMSGDSLTVAASGYAEINVISDGTNMYIRTL